MDIREIDHVEINVWDNSGKHKILDEKGTNAFHKASRWMELLGDGLI